MNKKNIFIYLIIVFLIISKPITVFAQASATTPTVTIAAGSGAAVGGLYNNNGTKTQMIATALTLAVLSATGAAVRLTESSVNAGKTVYQVINDKFAQWVGGTSAEELSLSEAEELQSRFKVITGGGGSDDPDDPDQNKKSGVNVDDLGRLFFNRGSLAMIREFIKYLESQDDIKELPVQDETMSTVNLGQYSTVMSNSITLLTDSGNVGLQLNMSIPCAVFVNLNGDGTHSNIFAISNEPFTYWGSASSGSARYYNGYYSAGYNGPMGRNNYTPEGAAAVPLTKNQVIDSITKWEVGSSGQGVETDGIYGDQNWNDSILDNNDNKVLVIDPGIMSGFNVDSDKQLNIPDYLQLIIDQAEQNAKQQADASAQPVPVSVPAIDPATGVKAPVIWNDPNPDPIEDPWGNEYIDPSEQTPDNPVQDTSADPSSQESIELMLVDLTRIFPFCIPWDIYNLISKFNTDPVTPSIDIDFGNILGSVGVDYTMHIDLHEYDGVAQVLRTMELIAFVLGLAAATRSIYLHD